MFSQWLDTLAPLSSLDKGIWSLDVALILLIFPRVLGTVWKCHSNLLSVVTRTTTHRWPEVNKPCGN